MTLWLWSVPRYRARRHLAVRDLQANGKLDIERLAGLEPDRLFIPSPGGEPKTSEAGSESMGSGRHFGCFVLAIAKVAEKPTVDRRANSR